MFNCKNVDSKMKIIVIALNSKWVDFNKNKKIKQTDKQECMFNFLKPMTESIFENNLN
jgi:hypothetical protein